jgi:tRNA(adenine34) deaminase
MMPTPGPEELMRRAIAVARRNPRYPFGALLVHRGSGQVLAEGVNRAAENPTWHGEIDAMNRCAEAHPGIDWTELALYSTAEPCAMCQAAVCWAGIGLRVRHFDPLSATAGLAAEVVQRAPFHRCQVQGGVLESACNSLFEEATRLTSEART